VFVVDQYRDAVKAMLADIVEQQGVFADCPRGNIHELCTELATSKDLPETKLHHVVAAYLNRDLLSATPTDVRKAPPWWKVGEDTLRLNSIRQGPFKELGFKATAKELRPIFLGARDALADSFKDRITLRRNRGEFHVEAGLPGFTMTCVLIVAIRAGSACVTTSVSVFDRNDAMICNLILDNAFLENGGPQIGTIDALADAVEKRVSWIAALGEHLRVLFDGCAESGG